jgi:hypothetical protein
VVTGSRVTEVIPPSASRRPTTVACEPVASPGQAPGPSSASPWSGGRLGVRSVLAAAHRAAGPGRRIRRRGSLDASCAAASSRRTPMATARRGSRRGASGRARARAVGKLCAEASGRTSPPAPWTFCACRIRRRDLAPLRQVDGYIRTRMQSRRREPPGGGARCPRRCGGVRSRDPQRAGWRERGMQCRRLPKAWRRGVRDWSRATSPELHLEPWDALGA